MASAQSLIGLLGVALSIAWVAATSIRGPRRGWLAAAAFAGAWIPVSGLTMAGYVRGVSGDLSISTLVVLGVSTAGRLGSGERRVLFAGVGACAVFLYPMALGIGRFDPYRLGFGPDVLLAVAFVAAVAAWLWKRYVVVACLVFAVAGHALDLMESSNLWDYLLDPWLVLVALYELRRPRRKA